MTSIVQEMQELLNDLQKAEQRVEILKKFESEGGQYRMGITIEHPDWHIRESVEAAWHEFVSKPAVLRWLVEHATNALEKRKEEFLATAMSHGISQAAQTQPELRT
ncbi:hypothetical protein J2045_003415 [Peteryoungia aggregata LMG 23059]|uniref:Uncharacterized protein n=1 Tax=Peteryoungia aggregata LMG 23059 TaxID=1368425 RepID=A0ABU0GAI6_9HYPH|nr:hypothetical protein [Peteryoungia aggregata]MDQ0422367.1 hypothetical protein [Peteryoungia aggregata LMG 23059]